MSDPSRLERPQSSSGQRPGSRSPSKRERLTTSSSYPCIPLLASAAGTSSPPAVTSAVAFGSNRVMSASPSPIPWIHSAETIEDDSPRTPGSILDRQYTGFPWGLHFKEQPQATTTNTTVTTMRIDDGMPTSAPELTGSKTGSSVASHPTLPHTRSDPTPASLKPNRNLPKPSPKSSLNLKLKLPPSRLVDVYGLPLPGGPLDNVAESQPTHGGFGMTVHDSQRPRSSLLGIAFPTTPDTNVNAICSGVSREGKRIGHVDIRGGMGPNHEIIGAGGATAALLAANPHLAHGGTALLTPPDDNGILEWRGGETTELLTPRMAAATAKASPAGGVCGNKDGKPIPLHRIPPPRRTEALRDSADIERTTDARMISGESTGTREEGRAARRETVTASEDPSVEGSGSSDNGSASHEDIIEEGWLKGAMTSLCSYPLSRTCSALSNL